MPMPMHAPSSIPPNLSACRRDIAAIDRTITLARDRDSAFAPFHRQVESALNCNPSEIRAHPVPDRLSRVSRMSRSRAAQPDRAEKGTAEEEEEEEEDSQHRRAMFAYNLCR